MPKGLIQVFWGTKRDKLFPLHKSCVTEAALRGLLSASMDFPQVKDNQSSCPPHRCISLSEVQLRRWSSTATDVNLRYHALIRIALNSGYIWHPPSPFSIASFLTQPFLSPTQKGSPAFYLPVSDHKACRNLETEDAAFPSLNHS